jgi:hypothetical protein
MIYRTLTGKLEKGWRGKNISGVFDEKYRDKNGKMTETIF